MLQHFIRDITGNHLTVFANTFRRSDRSYARKLVTAISGGVFDLLDTVLEFHSLDDLGELA